ncbi:MAG: 50S ribosomal protein L2, partial [Patescibacteria group bacterium]
MPVKNYKPTTPGRRHAGVLLSEVSRQQPLKKLTRGKTSKAGRNSQGRITVRHRGGGAKRLLRTIDTKRQRYDLVAKVEAIEYDPNRTANLALLVYPDGTRSYILAPAGLKMGDRIVSSKNQVEIKTGNRLPLKHIPAGVQVHDIELVPGQGGVMVKSAG